MGTAKSQMWCPKEERVVLAERTTANHILHLLLSLVTVGLWIPVWILLTIFSGPYRCPSCGTKTKARWREPA